MKYKHHEKPWFISVLLSVIGGFSGMVEGWRCIIIIQTESLIPLQEEESRLLMLDLKHNVFSLYLTGVNSFFFNFLFTTPRWKHNLKRWDECFKVLNAPDCLSGLGHWHGIKSGYHFYQSACRCLLKTCIMQET